MCKSTNIGKAIKLASFKQVTSIQSVGSYFVRDSQQTDFLVIWCVKRGVTGCNCVENARNYVIDFGKLPSREGISGLCRRSERTGLVDETKSVLGFINFVGCMDRSGNSGNSYRLDLQMWLKVYFALKLLCCSVWGRGSSSLWKGFTVWDYLRRDSGHVLMRKSPSNSLACDCLLVLIPVSDMLCVSLKDNWGHTLEPMGLKRQMNCESFKLRCFKV